MGKLQEMNEINDTYLNLELSTLSFFPSRLSLVAVQEICDKSALKKVGGLTTFRNIRIKVGRSN
jgi:hypothetical protein